MAARWDGTGTQESGIPAGILFRNGPFPIRARNSRFRNSRGGYPGWSTSSTCKVPSPGFTGENKRAGWGRAKDPCLAPDDPRNLWQFFNKIEQNDKKKWRSECQCCGQKYWDLSPYKMLDHFGYPLTRETLLKFKPCSGIDKDEHKDVKATVQRIHAAEFAKKSALKLATAQGSRKLTESLRVNEFVTVEGRTFALGADEHRKIMKAVEARWDMLHSDLQSAAYILNPRYRHTHDFSGSAMQEHDALLQKWLSEDDLHTYKAEFGSYKEKTDIFSAQTIWTDKALEVDAHVWWDYWASGKKVLHDFATRVTSSRSRSAQRSDVGKRMRTFTAPNEIDLAMNEQQSSLACTVT